MELARMKVVGLRVFLVAILFLVSSLVEGAMKPEKLNVNLWPDNVGEFVLSSNDMKALVSGVSFVSIAPIEEQKFLIADYTDILLYDNDKKSIDIMKIDWTKESTGIKEASQIYRPTGLFFSKKNRVLYVANYKGNNIFVFNVDLIDSRLTFIGEIKSRNTQGPENVFVSKDGKFLVVANYDSGNVAAFNISGKKPVELWNTKIAGAHGVCISGGRVYATGLVDRAVFELDMKTGKVLRKLGKIGWSPENDGFLWPTSVYPFSKGEIIVSDAHTGYIYIIETGAFSIKSYFGGNGPGFRFLHLPYSAIIDKEKLIILSTFQRRIIFGKKNGLKITETVGMDKNDWKDIKRRKDIQQLGLGWSDYIWVNGPVLKLWNIDYVPGYGHVYPKDNTKGHPVLKANKTTSLFNYGNSYYYFLDALTIPSGGYLLFSPEAHHANYIISKKGITYFFPVNFVVEEHWKVGKSIYNPDGPVDVEEMVKDARQRLLQLEESRLANGLIKEKDLWSTIFADITEENFKNVISDTFSSKAGEIFFAGYRECLGKECSRADVKKLSQRYYGSVRNEKYIDIDEFILVQMLTNFMPRNFFARV